MPRHARIDPLPIRVDISKRMADWAPDKSTVMDVVVPTLENAVLNNVLARNAQHLSKSVMWACVVQVVLHEHTTKQTLRGVDKSIRAEPQRAMYYSMRALAWRALRRGLHLIDDVGGVLSFEMVCQAMADYENKARKMPTP